MREKTTKTEVRKGQTWRDKDTRNNGRTIHITGKRKDGRYNADSYNPGNYSGRSVTRVVLKADTIRRNFTLVSV